MSDNDKVFSAPLRKPSGVNQDKLKKAGTRGCGGLLEFQEIPKAIGCWGSMKIKTCRESSYDFKCSVCGNEKSIPTVAK